MVANGEPRRIIEKRKHKRFGDIFTTYKISNADGFDNTDPLNQFDYAVLSVCISNFAESNLYITPAIIYLGLTGKISKDGKGKIPPDMRDSILNSLKKAHGYYH